MSLDKCFIIFKIYYWHIGKKSDSVKKKKHYFRQFRLYIEKYLNCQNIEKYLNCQNIKKYLNIV